MMMPRDYQLECLENNKDAYDQGVRRALNALPTGTGKTNIGGWSYGALDLGPMLWVAHREELIDQTEERLKELNPHARVGVEQAKRTASPSDDIVIASISTIHSRPERLERLEPDRFASLFFDECHHTLARMWLNLLHRFKLAPDVSRIPQRAFTDRGYRQRAGAYLRTFEVDASAPYFMGFTATPHRTDRLGLEYVFDRMVFSRNISEMIEAGWLCPIRAWRIKTEVDLSAVGTDPGRDDYRLGQLTSVVNTERRNNQAVQAYRDFAPYQQAICFCVDVEHTYDMERAFKSAGIVAASVVGSTPSRERRKIIEDYRKGYIQVLVNCMVLTEGFDAPETACVIMARPTQSQLLYTQTMGRGTRPHPSKEYLTLIDLVDNQSTGVCTVNTIFGLDPRLTLTGTDPGQLARELEQAARSVSERESPGPRTSKVIAQTGEYDALAPISPPEEYGATMAWVKVQYGWSMGLGQPNEYISLVTDLLGRCQVKVQVWGRVYWLEDYGEEVQALHAAGCEQTSRSGCLCWKSTRPGAVSCTAPSKRTWRAAPVCPLSPGRPRGRWRPR
jgi:superfamily II DNA or RNA helicase